jgi:hypothetical protein
MPTWGFPRHLFQLFKPHWEEINLERIPFRISWLCIKTTGDGVERIYCLLGSYFSCMEKRTLHAAPIRCTFVQSTKLVLSSVVQK